MARGYQQNQLNRLREHFHEHPYYKLCRTVYGVFQKSCPTMVMTPEQLFVDAAHTLDGILQTGDVSAERCHNLWTDTYNTYCRQNGKVCDTKDIKAMVAMLFYVVMYGLATVGHSHYSGTLQRVLHKSIHTFYGKDECLQAEQALREPMARHTAEMQAWMNGYFVSKDSLTKEIDAVANPQRGARTKENPKEKEKPCYTLKYNCPNEMMRVKRIDAVMRMMTGWKWIKEPQEADDFQAFFGGLERNCNLKWIESAAILTDLMKQLLKQHYIDKVTGVSARSIVMNQFMRTPDNLSGRLDKVDLNRIQWVMRVLDYNKPLPLPQNHDDEDFDTTYKAAMQAVFAKEMHTTKDLKRKFK